MGGSGSLTDVVGKLRGTILMTILVALAGGWLCLPAWAEILRCQPICVTAEVAGPDAIESHEGQQTGSEARQKKATMLVLLLLVTFILLTLVFVILVLGIRYARGMLLSKKEEKPTRLQDVWWLADPKSGKPVQKKENKLE